MSKKIFLDWPVIAQNEYRYVMKALKSPFLSTAGQFVPEFERKFAQYLKTPMAVSLQSGTTALHIGLHELGIEETDEVIVPALTFIASVNPVRYVNATPVFCDVDKDTWNIDTHKIETLIRKNTKAIIPVHLYGNPCDMSAIMALAKKYNLYVIEDATESLGARIDRKFTGTFGTFGVFSFNGNKIITTGGGGMIVSNDTKSLMHIKYLINQARDVGPDYIHSEIGFNYRMTNIESSLGIAQLERLPALLKKKEKIASIYRNELISLPFISFQKEIRGAKSSWWFTVILFDDSIDIVQLKTKLEAQGIPVRRVFTPLPDLAPYRQYKLDAYPNAAFIYEHGLCFPSSPRNSESNIIYVCKQLKNILKKLV